MDGLPEVHRQRPLAQLNAAALVRLAPVLFVVALLLVALALRVKILARSARLCIYTRYLLIQPAQNGLRERVTAKRGRVSSLRRGNLRQHRLDALREGNRSVSDYRNHKERAAGSQARLSLERESVPRNSPGPPLLSRHTSRANTQLE